jgi:hypothetical protein
LPLYPDPGSEFPIRIRIHKVAESGSTTLGLLESCSVLTKPGSIFLFSIVIVYRCELEAEKTERQFAMEEMERLKADRWIFSSLQRFYRSKLLPLLEIILQNKFTNLDVVNRTFSNCASQCCGSGSGIRDPGSGAFLPPVSGILIRDEFFPDLGSRIQGVFFTNKTCS